MSRRALVSLVFAAALAACTLGPQSTSTTSLPVVNRSSQARALHRSWMTAGASKQDLLYVSDGNGEVTVYRYWQHTLVGAIADVTQPMGECVDSGGNVYITDYAAKKIFEYAHGGTKAIKKLDDSPDSPYACSVDPTTGNLAVANNDGTSKQGNIAIWTKASGQPKIYGDSKVYNFIGCAYDNAGNLLTTNAGTYSNPANFAWLPKGGSSLVDVRVPGPKGSWKWDFITGIEWDGKYFSIGSGYLYRITVTHGQAYYVGMTSFTSSGIGASFWFYNNKPGSQATELVAGEYSDTGVSRVYYWGYPSGGSPVYTLTHGIDDPVGLTISLKTP